MSENVNIKFKNIKKKKKTVTPSASVGVMKQANLIHSDTHVNTASLLGICLASTVKY